MIPAGYLAYQGKMNLIVAILAGIAWSIAGAWFNYILASKLGRKFLKKFISQEKINKLDNFFENHWHISTFTGRLIPGIRQYISFPAWLAKMNPFKFTLYTGLWAGIWVVVLALLWYFIWANQELIHKYLKQITLFTLLFVVVLIIVYVFWQRKFKK
jgi:membrane protein DedA with SNARE-associated domain